MKKNFKEIIIGTVIGIILCSIVGVCAVTYFPSNQTTYDNKASGLNATNVQDAIDELYKKADSSTINSSKLKDLVVTTGSGLYADEYEEGRYIYRGNYVDNYITFNNEEWRILSIEKDGTMKIINLTGTGETSSGTTHWNSSSNNWLNSRVNTYLNGTYYNKLSTTAKNLIVAGDFNVGGVRHEKFTDLQDIVNDEKNAKWNGKIALLTLTELLRTNTGSSCVNNPFGVSYYDITCGDSTWVNYVSSNGGWMVLSLGWLLTPDKDSSSQTFIFRSFFKLEDLYDEHYYTALPVVHIKSGLQLSGYGSKTHPFVIEN